MKTHSFLTELETYDAKTLKAVIDRAEYLLKNNIDNLTLMRNSTEYKNLMQEFIDLRSIIDCFAASVKIPIEIECDVSLCWEYMIYDNDFLYNIKAKIQDELKTALLGQLIGMVGGSGSYAVQQLIHKLDVDLSTRYNNIMNRLVNPKGKFAELLAKYNVNTNLEVEIPFYEKGAKP